MNVFGWSEALATWSRTGEQPLGVQRVLEHLKAASNPLDGADYPVTHFLKYLNYEQDGLLWFLYECVAHSWMWGSPRLDYIEAVLNEVDDLEDGFPEFPGSPRDSLSVREFLNKNLTEEQLDMVNMMPPLVRQCDLSYQSYQTPPPAARNLSNPPPIHRVRQNCTAPLDGCCWTMPVSGPTVRAVPPPPSPVAPVAHSVAPVAHSVARRKDPSYAPFVVRAIRFNSSSSNDDVLTLRKDGEDRFSILFNDMESGVRNVMRDLDRTSVLNNFSIALRSMHLDDDPFRSIQILHPTLPTVLVKVENLRSQTRDLIYDSIESAMDNWPMTVPA
jgi:hypothetical protein